MSNIKAKYSDRDLALIVRAQNSDWTEIDFENEAESAAASEEIHRIMMKKYHADEAMAGID